MDKHIIYEKKISLSILFSLVFIVCFMFFKPNLKVNEYKKENFWINKTFTNKDYNTILFGDSRVYRGLNPEIIEHELPLNCVLNAGFSSAGLDGEYINYYLSKLNINTIIFGISPNEFTDQACLNSHFNEYRSQHNADIFIKKNIYPFFFNMNVYSFKSLFQNSNPKTLSEEFTANGFVKSNVIKIDSSMANNSYIDNFTRQKVNNQRIDEFLKLIHKLTIKKLTVIAFEMPISMQLHQIEDSLSGFNRSIFKKNFIINGGRWIDVDRSQLKLVNYDGSHLNESSANSLSVYIAKKIKGFKNE